MKHEIMTSDLTQMQVGSIAGRARGRRLARAARAVALFGATLALLSACANPKQDDFRFEGGISPDPSGIITGSVVYVGPRPRCLLNGDGEPSRVYGRVILTLFEFDNPPPPDGRAASAKNLLVISGNKLFALEDCVPKGQSIDPKEKITRSVPFRWTGITLENREVNYQIRGFYDADEDMNPFFSVKNLPTAGDVAGAAVVDITGGARGLLPVSMPALADARDGVVREGVTVVLGSYVWTERPAVKLSSNRAISAEEPLPVTAIIDGKNPIQADVDQTMRNTWALSCARDDASGGCGLALESLRASETEQTFLAADVRLSFDDRSYAFFTKPVDVRTIVKNGKDLVQPDGLPDPHPILGTTTSLGLPWVQPMVLMTRIARGFTAQDTQRAQQVETQAGVPTVLLVGSVLPDEVKTQRTFVDSINIAVPPVAVLDLDPNDSQCRVPVAAPGNSTRTFESRVVACADLPTGVYGVNVLSGVMGGERVNEDDPAVSENGVLITGSKPGEVRFSGQAWSLPNELADPAQVGADNVLSSQGLDRLFLVHDPEPSTQASCETAVDPDQGVPLVTRAVRYRGLCQEGEMPALEDEKGVDGLACLPPSCCEGVAHLCDVKLCEVEQLDGRNVRKSPTKLTGKLGKNGKPVPECIPFELPRQCCE